MSSSPLLRRLVVVILAVLGMLGAGAMMAQSDRSPADAVADARPQAFRPQADNNQPPIRQIALSLHQGNGMLSRHQYRQAAAEFERADRLASGHSAEVNVGLARAYTGLGLRFRAIAAAERAIELAPPAKLRAGAYNQLAVAHMLGRASEDDIAAAEAALRQVISLADTGLARYNLAAVLLERRAIGEAVAEARRSLAEEPRGLAAKDARILVCHHRVAPPEPIPEGASASAPSAPPAAVPAAEMKAAEGPGVQRPEAIYRELPSYDQAEVQGGSEPHVVVGSIIDEEGCVLDVEVLESQIPRLNRGAAEAVRKWVFEPAVYEGRPIPVRFSTTISFLRRKPAQR